MIPHQLGNFSVVLSHRPHTYRQNTSQAAAHLSMAQQSHGICTKTHVLWLMKAMVMLRSTSKQ